MENPLIGSVAMHENVRKQLITDEQHNQVVICDDCGNESRHLEFEKAKQNLALTKCNPDCELCEKLRHGSGFNPAIPDGAQEDTIRYTCPNDDNHWHLTRNSESGIWRLIANPNEWQSLQL